MVVENITSRQFVDRIDIADVDKVKLICSSSKIAGMDIRRDQKRKTYAANRLCRAIERLVNAGSIAEKELAIKWANAWSTAYLMMMERRHSANSATYSRQSE